MLFDKLEFVGCPVKAGQQLDGKKSDNAGHEKSKVPAHRLILYQEQHQSPRQRQKYEHTQDGKAGIHQ